MECVRLGKIRAPIYEPADYVFYDQLGGPNIYDHFVEHHYELLGLFHELTQI